MYKQTLVLLILLFHFCAFFWKSYNPDSPEAYDEYWKNVRNRKDSILYKITEKESMPNDPLRHLILSSKFRIRKF